jgi:RNA polymerase sigma factor (sigma-70 family)
MPEGLSRADFEARLLPFLGQAYNHARWLVRNRADAEDMVQEAYLKAFRGYAGFLGAEPRAWLLAIVRNTCLSHLRQQRSRIKVVQLRPPAGVEDEELDDWPADAELPVEERIDRQAADARLRETLWLLPELFREAIVLHDLEELTYAQVAAVTGVPVGTVMSRLSRGRARLRELIEKDRKNGARHEL